MLEQLFDQFKRERQYLNNLAPTTIKYYGFVFNSWNRYVSEFPNKQNIKNWVILLNESRITSFTVNSYIRGFNAFLNWLFENEYTSERLFIKKVKQEKRKPKVFSEDDLKKILSFKPRTYSEQRTFAMVCLLVDTGIRIDEALTLERGKVDLDNFLIKVVGKGNKERVVPISLECRKLLFKYMKKHNNQNVFSTMRGDKLSYRTSLQHLHRLCRKVGSDGSWHRFRHTFATNYLRSGGNVFYLQRVLGHENLSVTKIYIDDNFEDLQMMQKKTSLLSRLK